MGLTFAPTTADDFDELVELRINAMRESLEAIGRLSRERSIERFRSSFVPDNTERIKMNEKLVGFIAVSEKKDHLYLDHLYVDPDHQSSGIGSIALKRLIEAAEEKELPIRLRALKASRSNDFYTRHGFVVTNEDEFDINCERKMRSEQGAGPGNCGNAPHLSPRPHKNQPPQQIQR